MDYFEYPAARAILTYVQNSPGRFGWYNIAIRMDKLLTNTGSLSFGVVKDLLARQYLVADRDPASSDDKYSITPHGAAFLEILSDLPSQAITPQDVVDMAIRSLLASGLATPDTLRGCDEAALHDLETALGYKLPLTYHQFMLACGASAGKFMQGSDFRIGEISPLSEYATRLLTQNNLAALAADDFVFLGHQGYQFLWFHLGVWDDPPVYASYVEGEVAPRQVAAYFSEWLIGAVTDEIVALHDLTQR